MTKTKIKKKIFIFLFSVFLISGCSKTSSSREWIIEENPSKISCFKGGRLLLSADTDYSHLELELVRNPSGIRFYINILFLEAPAFADDPARTSITILFEDTPPWTVYPWLLKGGQRLLLPDDVAAILIQSLMDDLCFSIHIGNSQINVVPTQFKNAYARLIVD